MLPYIKITINVQSLLNNTLHFTVARDLKQQMGNAVCRYRFHDPRNRKIYQARVAFQIWVKPGSYKVGGQAQGSGEDIAQQVDPHFRNSELAWSTKEKGSLMLHALLLKVE